MQPEKPMTSPAFEEVFTQAVTEQFGHVGELILSGRLTPAHLATMELQAEAALEAALREACIDVIYGWTPKES